MLGGDQYENCGNSDWLAASAAAFSASPGDFSFSETCLAALMAASSVALSKTLHNSVA
jgi:hypothetical protein